MTAGSAGLTGSAGSVEGVLQTGSAASTGSAGSYLGGVLETVRGWLGTYISVADELDLDLLALWAAHTHVAMETYTTPRLVLDSAMPGSGKTTVLEHLQRLCVRPIQAASISSPALLARMLDREMRTILIDEVDRSLDPKKPGVEDLIAILNSGYKRGATRPVLVPGRGGEWDVAEMTTYSPVAMAGNAPALPDDTRSRCIRVLLMPDLFGTVESSDWEEIEPTAVEIGESLAEALDRFRDDVRTVRPPLPAGCVGRVKEKWHPLARVAAVAGGRWPSTVESLINRDLEDIAMEREEGLMKLPPAVVLLRDLHSVWGEHEVFVATPTLIGRLIALNPEYWGDGSSYGRQLTAQRMGRMLTQSAKVRATRDSAKARGYARSSFERVWRQLGIALSSEPAGPVEAAEPVLALPEEEPW
ncbi:DUF3631 domain-containing protein [Microbacterium sp. C7(2022)]|uniref:DUF3631 domain-containing protein n=1 Tax=Microbacterium sp. C7(2022) TaxID=2992759 RepID=UPI00237BD735|nr:DUF3631 domain-containing protein [Microbacterium sp. C7(2022)]MDE0545486.1 DUF3631 domain-containing protein [Microbacterium sp. C7(2022)]